MSTGAYSSFRSHINHRTKAARTNRERLNRGGWAQMEAALGTAAAPPPAPSPREIEEAFNNFGFDGVSSNRTLSIGEVAVGLRQLRLPVDHTLVQALLTKLEDEGVTSVGYQQFEGLVEQASAIGGRIERRRIAMQAELKLPLLDELITRYRVLLDKTFIEHAGDRAGAERAVSPQALIEMLRKYRTVPRHLDEDGVRLLLADLNWNFVTLGDWDELLGHIALAAHPPAETAADGERTSGVHAPLSELLSRIERLRSDAPPSADGAASAATSDSAPASQAEASKEAEQQAPPSKPPPPQRRTAKERTEADALRQQVTLLETRLAVAENELHKQRLVGLRRRQSRPPPGGGGGGGGIGGALGLDAGCSTPLSPRASPAAHARAEELARALEAAHAKCRPRGRTQPHARPGQGGAGEAPPRS